MYSKNEKHLVRATLLYYDNEYCSDYYPKEILKLIKGSPFSQPKWYYAGFLTRNKFIKVDDDFEYNFVKSYTEKDVFDVAITNGDINKEENFWEFDWKYTFYKEKNLDRSDIIFKPWNVISITVSHQWLDNPTNKEAFLKIFFDIIDLIKPLYGNIDDVANKNDLLEKAGYDCVRPDNIQQIYWGNYISSELCNASGITSSLLDNLPAHSSVKMDGGTFFSLSGDPLDFKSGEISKARRKIRKLLGIRKTFK